MSELITPGNLSHLHLLLNHFPTVGLTVAFALLVISIISDSEAMKNDTMRPTAFGVLFGIAVMTLPVFTTGLAAEGGDLARPFLRRGVRPELPPEHQVVHDLQDARDDERQPRERGRGHQRRREQR